MPSVAPRARRPSSVFSMPGKMHIHPARARFSACQTRMTRSMFTGATSSAARISRPGMPKVDSSALYGSTRPSSCRRATCNPVASAEAESSNVPSMSKAMQRYFMPAPPPSGD